VASIASGTPTAIEVGRTMPDRLRSVDPLLPLKPKVLHILLALADRPRHGYSIMQEVLERTDRQVRLWPAGLYGLLRELEKLDLIVESDKRPSAGEDDERRRYFALTPHGKRVLDAEVRRLEAIVHHARSSRALRRPIAHDR
jgi:DNA-binding PadR family transcriptional regulator